MIRAIPTMFDGILYRSKLEACWASFFSELGIVFDYEVEGYQLPSGNYLPDFYLPKTEGGIWAEVKARHPEEHEIDLARELADETGHHCVILVGSPMVALHEYGYPFLLTHWSMDALLSAAMRAHRSVRWDPNRIKPSPPPVKVPRKVGRSWQRRHA